MYTPGRETHALPVQIRVDSESLFINLIKSTRVYRK